MKLSITLPSLHKNLVESTITRIYSTTENIDYEIIVVSPFKISGPNIKWVPETEPTGNCGAHAAAWEASEGDIIVAMCDDFVPGIGCFESVVSFLIEREKSYFPYACGLNWNIGQIGTVFGYYYPYIPALSRKSIEKIAGYYLRDYISDYGDCDIGMRIWDANGRCELCEAAEIDSIGDRLGIPHILPNRGISLKKGADIFEEKWQEKYGKGWGSQYNVNLPFSVLREHTFYKASSLTVKVLTTLKDSDYIIKQLNEPSQLFPQEIILNKPSEILSSGILHHQANLLNIKGHSLGKSDCMLLESLMKKIAKNKMKVVEIGSWKGMTTSVIGGVLSDYEGTLFAIDTWKGSSSVPSMEREARSTDVFNVFIQNMKMLGLFNEVVTPIVMESTAAAQIFQDNSLDFIFIDGDHRYSSVKIDILSWWSKLKDGGVICGHCGDGYYSKYPEALKAKIEQLREVDYIFDDQGMGLHPGVVKALYDVFADQYEIMADSSIWYYQKTSDQFYQSCGDSLAKEGKLEEAVNCYQKVKETIAVNPFELNPNSAESYQKLADIFLARGNHLAALFCYCNAFESNPEESSLLQHSLWGTLAKTQTWDEAVVWYRRVIEIKPEISWLHHHLGSALMALQRWEEAATSFRRATELTPDSFWSQQLLGESLKKVGYGEEAILAYQRAIKLQPDATNVYLSLGQLLISQGRSNEAILVYRQVLQMKPDDLESYCQLIWLLSQQNQWDEAIECYNKACEITPEFSDLEQLKKNFQETNEYNFIKINSLSENERHFLENAGLSLEYLELISKDNQDWKVAMKAASPVYGGLPKLPVFQHRILDTGYIDSVCPISGNILRSNQSFLMGQDFYIIFYRFMGAEVFYLMVASNYTYKLAIYLPSREMILVFYDEECGLGSERMSPRWFIEQHVNTLKSYTLGFFNDVKSYLVNDKPKLLTAALGFHNNIGHFIWNEVSGLQDIYQAGKFRKLEALAVGGYNYGLDLRHIFPEMEQENTNLLILNVPGKLSHLGFEAGVKNNLFIFTPAYYGITEELGSRLYNNSYSQCREEILQQVGESKKHFPLLWITLRSHHRAWVSQVEGIASVIEKLSQEYCDLGVIFDGVPTEKGSMDKIIGLIPSTVKTYNALDCNMYETIVWVHAPDLFVAPYGAGSIFPSIANKTGVYHTNKEWSKAEPFCPNPRENCTLTVMIPIDAVADEMDAVYHCHWMRNYNCDWQAIYKEVVKIIEELKN